METTTIISLLIGIIVMPTGIVDFLMGINHRKVIVGETHRNKTMLALHHSFCLMNSFCI